MIFTIRAESLQISIKKEPEKPLDNDRSTQQEMKVKIIINQRPIENISYNPIAKQKWMRKSLGMDENLSTYSFID